MVRTSTRLNALSAMCCAGLAASHKAELQGEPRQLQANATTTMVIAATTTLTTTAFTAGSAAEECWQKAVGWEPLDMFGVKANLSENLYPDECQRKCKATKGCTHFTVLPRPKVDGTYHDFGTCHLEDAYAVRVDHHVGAISGPFECWTDIKRDEKDGTISEDYRRVKPAETYVTEWMECLEIGVSYSPVIMTPGHRAMFMSAGHYFEIIESCREYCANTEGCAHFSVSLDTRLCHLARASAHKSKGLVHTVSGPPEKCDAKTPARKFIDMGAVAQDGHAFSIFAVACVMASVLAVGLGLFLASRRKTAATRQVRAGDFDEELQGSAQVLVQGGLE